MKQGKDPSLHYAVHAWRQRGGSELRGGPLTVRRTDEIIKTRHPHDFFFFFAQTVTFLGKLKGKEKCFFEEEGDGRQEEEMESDLSV